MACMYPDQLSPDTKSNAERRLYQAFQDELDSSYTVFHSVAWLSLDGEGRPRDGEADFVIVHPTRGILTLEAKGGSIHYDPGTGYWTSTDRHGRTHNIKDPFAQARYSKYALRDRLGVMLHMPPQRHINIGHAVAFPDVFAGEVLLGPDKPREIVLDATDLANIPVWVVRLSHKTSLGKVATVVYTKRDNQCQLEVIVCPANRCQNKRMIQRKPHLLSKPCIA